MSSDCLRSQLAEVQGSPLSALGGYFFKLPVCRSATNSAHEGRKARTVPARARTFVPLKPYLLSSTCRLSVTENTFGTPFVCISAICLSICRATTPSSVTLPFLTIM